MISSIHILGFLMKVQEGRIGKGEDNSHYVDFESLRESIEVRMEAMVEEILGASFHGGLMEV
jgi:hypothetical protein